MSDIVERLLKVESSTECPTGSITTNWYRNPDGPEAAAEITRLRAENEALRRDIRFCSGSCGQALERTGHE